MKKIVLLAFVPVLLSTAIVIEFVRLAAGQQGTIYIRPDGSVVPSTASIQQDGNIYTFIDNIYDSIVIERSNIIIDGNGYTLQGSGSGYGFTLSGINNVTIKNTSVNNFESGVYLNSTLHNVISGNDITNNNYDGILLRQSSDNTLSGNNIRANNHYGINLTYSSDSNAIFGNNVTANAWNGVYLFFSSNNRIYGNNITLNTCGVYVGEWSTDNCINYNTIINNYNGVYHYFSSDNILTGNNVSNNKYGISLFYSSNNTVSGNDASNNTHGIFLHDSSNSLIFNNNFINNTEHINSDNSLTAWDAGYPSGGNYLSNYTGVDLYSGPSQNETGSDGTGDTPYTIDVNNQDNYPLMGRFSDFHATSEYHVQTICNSSISDFQFNGTAIVFNVSGENGTSGFCRICIPTALMNGTYKVFVNGIEIPYNLLLCSNSTYSYLYFAYNHSTQEVIIMPEFPTWTLMLLILMVFTVAAVIYKRRLPKTFIH